MKKFLQITAAAIFTAVLAPTMALADSIDPAYYEDTLALGESVTIRKTVTVDAGAPSAAPIDIMFLFDTTGSMGGEIDAAKSVANSLLTTLDTTYGTVRSGSGWYADPSHDGVETDLNSGNTGVTSGIDSMYACKGGCGGDYPEVGYAGLYDVANDASWAPASNRFVVVFGDATLKNGPDGTDTQASAIAALQAEGVTVIGVTWGGLASSLTPVANATGGSIWAGGTDGATIANAITAGISSSFASYTNVTVDDIPAAAGVDVTAVCVSADTGTCVGDSAIGSYDRSVARTFEYDVTFTGTAVGDHAFTTSALVDGGAVAAEVDLIHVTAVDVPEPSTIALLGLGLLGLGVGRRRRS